MPVRDLLSAASTQGGGPTDPYFYDVSLLLNGDGTNGAQNNTFLDSSTNNFTITRNGNTTQGSFSPYGSLWGNYFNGSNTFYTAPASADFNMGSGAFCYEMWICMPTLPSSAQYTFINNWVGSALDMFISYRNDVSPAGFYFYYNNNGSTFNVPNSTFTPVAGTWYHIVVNRDGSGNLAFFINGTRYATTSSTAQVGNSTTVFTTGANIYNGTGSPSSVHNGYISNIRAVKGYSVYDPTLSSLTVPTVPLSAITGTVFLTAQSNRFIDNSSSTRTLTVYNSPSVQRFSPFNPTAPYDTATIGGSGYFDGSGDYLSIPQVLWSANGNATFEGWIYATSYSNQKEIFNTSGQGDFCINTNGTLRLHVVDNNYKDTSGTITLNAWTHVAVVQTSSNRDVFINGVLQTYSTTVGSPNTAAWNNPSGTFNIGYAGLYRNDFVGYMGNVRITNTAVYSTTFTPPTAPVTAISGTLLLANCTNAGIPDFAMMNDLQTVGNAQVSTSVKKYGTGSLSFNGTTDYLISPAKTTTTMSGDFSVECWAYHASATGNSCLWCIGDDGTASGISLILANSGTAIYLYANNSYLLNLTGQPSTLNSWIYWSVIRSGSTITLYRNGTSIGTATYSTAFSGALYVGVELSTAAFYNYCNGYIDDLRITNGYARPSTVPTSALPTY